MSLSLEFAGWFQCRLATDPDPTDEPRGVSGTTFAVAGEPDLDGVIRLQDPPPDTTRSHAPAIGVVVRRVRVDGRLAPSDHPLIGATVDLAGEPRFWSRNRILGDPGHEPIHPIDVRVAGRGIRLARKDPLDPARPRQSVWQAPPAVLARHAPHGVTWLPAAMIALSGVGHPRAYVQARLALVEAELAGERDAGRRAALGTRARELRATLDTPRDRRILGLMMCQQFGFALAGPGRVTGRDAFAKRVRTSPPWPIRFTMGVWDADAMSGFMMGTLTVPLRAAHAR